MQILNLVKSNVRQGSVKKKFIMPEALISHKKQSVSYGQAIKVLNQIKFLSELRSRFASTHILTLCSNCMTLFATDPALIMFQIQNSMLGP